MITWICASFGLVVFCSGFETSDFVGKFPIHHIWWAIGDHNCSEQNQLWKNYESSLVRCWDCWPGYSSGSLHQIMVRQMRLQLESGSSHSGPSLSWSIPRRKREMVMSGPIEHINPLKISPATDSTVGRRYSFALLRLDFCIHLLDFRFLRMIKLHQCSI